MSNLITGGKVNIGWTRRHQQQVFEWNNSPFTPDLYRLAKYRQQLIFVYDEWMKDRRSSFVLDGCAAYKTDGFSEDRFNFLVKATDGTPVAIPDDKGNRIKGQVFSIPEGMVEQTFLKLDKLKLNGLQFIRRRVVILDPYRDEITIDNGEFTEDGVMLPDAIRGKKTYVGPEKIYRLNAWMYFGLTDYWLDMIHEQPYLFNRVPTFAPKKDKLWLDEYYKYQNPD